METKIIRNFAELNGLENGTGLVIQSDLEFDVLDVYAKTSEEGRLFHIAKIDFKDADYLKAMGFKFRYRPLRTKEEVIKEMREKAVSEHKRDVSLYEVFFYYPDFTYKTGVSTFPSVGTLYFSEELAQKYADELNEILKSES